MSGDKEPHVDTNSDDLKQGVEAGLNAGKDVKNWKAGSLFKESTTPLFMSDKGNKGNAQDEKDETEE